MRELFTPSRSPRSSHMNCRWTAAQADRRRGGGAEGRPATPGCAAGEVQASQPCGPHTLLGPPLSGVRDWARGQRCGRASPPRLGPAPGRSPPHTRNAAKPRSRPSAAGPGRGRRPLHRPPARLPPPPRPVPCALRPPPPPLLTARGSWAPSGPGPEEPFATPLLFAPPSPRTEPQSALGSAQAQPPPALPHPQGTSSARAGPGPT